jgi:hypothetical protein
MLSPRSDDAENSAVNYRGVVIDRFPTNLGLQFGLGVLSERRLRAALAHCCDSRSRKEDLTGAAVTASVTFRELERECCNRGAFTTPMERKWSSASRFAVEAALTLSMLELKTSYRTKCVFCTTGKRSCNLWSQKLQQIEASH